MAAPRELVVFGVGQLGQLYAAGALRLGLRVTPITRHDDPTTVLADLPLGTPILLAVSEDDLGPAVSKIPPARWGDLCLVQNELFPARWRALGLTEPTILVVWLSKKKARPVEVARVSPAYGKHAAIMTAMFEALELPAKALEDTAALDVELVAKFAFILTINALGLVENLTLGEWLARDPETVARLVTEAQALGEAHLGHPVPREEIHARVEEAMRGLSTYPARGRTASARLARAKVDAERFGLDVPALFKIAASYA